MTPFEDYITERLRIVEVAMAKTVQTLESAPFDLHPDLKKGLRDIRLEAGKKAEAANFIYTENAQIYGDQDMEA